MRLTFESPWRPLPCLIQKECGFTQALFTDPGHSCFDDLAEAFKEFSLVKDCGVHLLLSN